MAPELKDIKMGQLTTAVKELNELLFEPGDKNRIKIVGVSKEVLVSKLKEATAALDPAEGDKVTQATAETLQLLEIEIPEGVPVIGAEGGKEKGEEPKKAKTEQKAAKGKKKEKPPVPTTEFTRCSALLHVLKEKKPLSKEELAEKSNSLYTSNGGKDNLKEQKWAVNAYLQPLLGLDLVAFENDKYLLVV